MAGSLAYAMHLLESGDCHTPVGTFAASFASKEASRGGGLGLERLGLGRTWNRLRSHFWPGERDEIFLGVALLLQGFCACFGVVYAAPDELLQYLVWDL